jgi:hypothetical protein
MITNEALLNHGVCPVHCTSTFRPCSSIVDVYFYTYIRRIFSPISRKTYIRYVCNVSKFDRIDSVYTADFTYIRRIFSTISKTYTYIRRIYVYDVYDVYTYFATLRIMFSSWSSEAHDILCYISQWPAEAHCYLHYRTCLHSNGNIRWMSHNPGWTRQLSCPLTVTSLLEYCAVTVGYY